MLALSRLLTRLAPAVVLPLLIAGCAADSEEPSDSGDQGDELITESASDKVAFDFFVAKGLTEVQAAGIVGNLDQESSMSPTAVQPGGPGRGIAQWSVGERWNGTAKDNVVWFAAQRGESKYSLDLQLEFIWYELTTIGYGYDKLRAARTVSAAVKAFQDYYEICGACASSKRLAHANAALAQFGGKSAPATGGACSVAGVAGTCIATSACAAKTGHVATAGYCPGSDDVQCCTPVDSSSDEDVPAACNVGGHDGACILTSECATHGGTSTPGHCPGSSSVQCCTY